MRGRSVFVALLLLLAGCGQKSANRPTAAASKSPSPPKPVVCPLTGEERPPGFAVTRPALGVKIDNSKAARPQAGLENADIVYEELAEGGITRFLAMFHCSDAEDLGPVRSARLVDPEILVQYAPVLFAYSGGNPLVKDKVKGTAGIVDLRFGSNSKAFDRRKGRAAPHNLFTSTERLRALSAIKGAPKAELTFGSPGATPSGGPKSSPSKTAQPKGSPSPSPSGSPPPGAAVSFAYTGGVGVRYAYDAGTHKYLRAQGGQPHNSAAGAQLGAVNVIVMKVKVVPGTIKDAAGNLSPEITVIGEGEAVYLMNGLATKGKWSRSKLSEKTKFLTEDGKPMPLLSGNTWIHLLPNDRPITLE